WEVNAAGSDIWGAADSFRYVYHTTRGDHQHVIVRIGDVQNTNPFAKVGVMLRARLEPDAQTVLLDVRPTGDVEFMQRTSSGDNMQYVAGTHVTLPAWLQLEWTGAADSIGTTTVTASVSQDKVHWQTVGGAVPFSMPPTYDVGLAVTSH